MEIIRGLLSKSYNNTTVLNKVPITIEKGEIYLVIGRNGCGKSTLLRMLAKVEEADFDVHLVAKNDISYMPSTLIFYSNMKTKDLLTFYKDTHNQFDYKNALTLINDFFIPLNKLIKKMSDGEKKILSFIICLSFKSSLYVIDEPFPNVDLINDEKFRKLILSKYDENTTFIIATHQINEFERLASKCILIKDANHLVTSDTEEIREGLMTSIEEYFKEKLK